MATFCHIGQVCTGSFVYLLPNVQYCGEEATGAQSKLNNASFPFLSQLPLRISFWNYQNYLSRPQRNHPYQFANQRVSERCFLFFAQTKLSHLLHFDYSDANVVWNEFDNMRGLGS